MTNRLILIFSILLSFPVMTKGQSEYTIPPLNEQYVARMDSVCAHITNRHLEANGMIIFVNEEGVLITEKEGVYTEYIVRPDSVGRITEIPILTFSESKTHKIRVDSTFYSYPDAAYKEEDIRFVTKYGRPVLDYRYGKIKRTKEPQPTMGKIMPNRLPRIGLYLFDAKHNHPESYHFTWQMPSNFPIKVFDYMISRFFWIYDTLRFPKQNGNIAVDEVTENIPTPQLRDAIELAISNYLNNPQVGADEKVVSVMILEEDYYCNYLFNDYNHLIIAFVFLYNENRNVWKFRLQDLNENEGKYSKDTLQTTLSVEDDCFIGTILRNHLRVR